MDLFDHAREKALEKGAPLAARMRPRTLDEYVGQQHILGPGRLLRRAIQADQLSSLIFYGPPGVGKTSLARIIAGSTRAHFAAINAVLAGVADIRREVEQARERLAQHGRRTILFVDEVHRFSKSQQDALLPHVENGTVILVGATTENPYFEVNKTLLSRSRIFELKPLEADDLQALMTQALADPTRGFGQRQVELAPQALKHLAHVANGDARAALNALELAVETTPPDSLGWVRVDLAVAEASIQKKAVLYDKEGDAHFDTISAFIKSLRGSDPDAALYWMARMVYAGEDARFILRRMLIFAAEDVGLADPQALQVVNAAAQAFEWVGMPEGRYHLSQACLYLALAPKSNSTMGFFDALAAVEKEKEAQPPNALRDASRDSQGFGHGQGYLYPHAYRDHWVAQQYLPDSLKGRLFYQPGELGLEASLKTRVESLREAQLAAAQEGPDSLGGPLPSSMEAVMNREAEFIRRSEGALAHNLVTLARHMLEMAALEPAHLVLDANTTSGLLVWPALRAAREGGVWALTQNPTLTQALTQQAQRLEGLARPVVLSGQVEDLPHLLEEAAAAGARFDRILLRNPLNRCPDIQKRLALLQGLLAPQGLLVIAQTLGHLSERLLAGVDWQEAAGQAGEGALVQKLLAAEEALYTTAGTPQTQWNEDDLAEALATAGLTVVRRHLIRQSVDYPLSPALIARWFTPGGEQDGKLGQLLGQDATAAQRLLVSRLAHKTLRRKSAVSLMVARSITH